MATEVQFRDGTTAEVNAFTGADSEAVIDKTLHRWHIHDATKAGGWPVPNAQDAAYNSFRSCTAGGTANALTGSLAFTTAALTDLMSVIIETPSANTGAVTFNLDSHGAKDVKKIDGSALESGDLVANGIYELVYSATLDDWVLVGGGGGGGGGGALQRVTDYYTTKSSHTTTIPIDTSIPQITEGEQIMSAAITPKSASSTLAIRISVPVTGSAIAHMVVALFVDSTANAIASGWHTKTSSSDAFLMFLETEISNASLTARTYKVRIGSHSGTAYVNGGAPGYYGGTAGAMMIIEEYA